MAGCVDPVEPSAVTQAPQPAPLSAPVTTNAPPSISGSPGNDAIVGNMWSFTPDAFDPDGDLLTFAIENQPIWASFDSTTGRLSGVPLLGQQGDYSNIMISVNDGQTSTTLSGFKVTVQNTSSINTPTISGTPPVAVPESKSSNNAPTVSGTPSVAVLVGQAYLFTPNASDLDDDNLTFSIANQPSWMSFNSVSGQLSGTPAQGDEAVYADIAISVSDGDQTASLPTFSITVSQAATGSVTLTWTAPTANTDGSPLTNLAAYKFYYGTTPGNYPNEVRVDNPGLTTYVIDNLVANTYYFVATTINTVEVESDYSNVATKTVN